MIPALIVFRHTRWWLFITLAAGCSLLSMGFVRVAEWALRKAKMKPCSNVKSTGGKSVDVEEKGKNKNTKYQMANDTLIPTPSIGRIKTHTDRAQQPTS